MIESRGGWDRCESSASHLNNSPKFYRPVGLRFSLLYGNLAKARIIEKGRRYSVLTPCWGEFAIEFCPRIIRADSWKIDKHRERLGRIKQLKNRPISIPFIVSRSSGLFPSLPFSFLPRFFPFRFLIFGSRVEWTKWSDEIHHHVSSYIFFFTKRRAAFDSLSMYRRV